MSHNHHNLFFVLLGGREKGLDPTWAQISFNKLDTSKISQKTLVASEKIFGWSLSSFGVSVGLHGLGFVGDVQAAADGKARASNNSDQAGPIMRSFVTCVQMQCVNILYIYISFI